MRLNRCGQARVDIFPTYAPGSHKHVRVLYLAAPTTSDDVAGRPLPVAMYITLCCVVHTMVTATNSCFDVRLCSYSSLPGRLLDVTVRVVRTPCADDQLLRVYRLMTPFPSLLRPEQTSLISSGLLSAFVSRKATNPLSPAGCASTSHF